MNTTAIECTPTPSLPRSQSTSSTSSRLVGLPGEKVAAGHIERLQASEPLRNGLKTTHPYADRELRRGYRLRIGNMMRDDAEAAELSETRAAFSRLHQLLMTLDDNARQEELEGVAFTS